MAVFVEQRTLPQLEVDPGWSHRSHFAAFVVIALLVAATVIGCADASHHGPQFKALLPLFATVWAFAELLTAYFLLSQFCVVGRLSYAIVAATYLVLGLLTIPYLVFFPGVFVDNALDRADLQISVWLWVAWHLAFPIAIASAHLRDPSLDRLIVPRSQIRRTVGLLIASATLVTIAIFAAIFLARQSLPIFIATGEAYGPAYKAAAVPLIVAANGLAIAVIVLRARRLSPLQTWLIVALFALLVDCVPNLFAEGRYGATWYIGKFEMLLMSSVVLGMLLLEVATLYRRMYDVATIDVLTGLPNRRSFIEAAANVLRENQHADKGIAMLVVDVDHFKSYNDRYGHLAGDRALIAVGSTLRSSLVRSYDFVARYGGEEFVILLPHVLVGEAEGVAERVRRRLSKLAIAHDPNTNGYLTVSVGIAHCSPRQTVSERALFETADTALYAAKANGRDCVVLRQIGEYRTGPAVTSVAAA